MVWGVSICDGGRGFGGGVFLVMLDYVNSLSFQMVLEAIGVSGALVFVTGLVVH
jgi:hypothetical protein